MADLKFSSKLDQPSKVKSLAIYSTQVRLYTYMLAYVQGHVPSNAYLVTRDRHDNPLPVSIKSQLNLPLDDDLSELHERYREIKLNGSLYRPWRDEIVACNWSNSQDAPWSSAKQRIATKFMPGVPLETLPRIGARQAKGLRQIGYRYIGDLMKDDVDRVQFEDLYGIGKVTANQLRAVLQANKSGQPSRIPVELVPTKRHIELYVDMEYFPNLHCNFHQAWPACLTGREMVFMVGCGWNGSDGEWHYEQFVAAREDEEAERKMFAEFVRLLKRLGVFEDRADAALYHYSPAESWQSKRAALRCGIPHLWELPWLDLRQAILDIPIGLPGAWNFGLKSIAYALAVHAPDYGIKWPDGLGDGASAAVVGWRMYESLDALRTREYDLLSKYLEADCKAMERALAWMRMTSSNSDHQRIAFPTAGARWFIPRKHVVRLNGRFWARHELCR